MLSPSSAARHYCSGAWQILLRLIKNNRWVESLRAGPSPIDEP
jgi:hypothetical protein